MNVRHLLLPPPLLLPLLLWVLVALSTPATALAELWVKPSGGTQFGTTDFDLSLVVDDQGDDLKVRSLLEWPVDFWLAGLSAGGTFEAYRGRDLWLIEGRLETNLGDARGTMEDSDWISSRSRGVAPFRFAHTNSETDSRALIAELTLGYRFAEKQDSEGLAFDLLLGYRSEHYLMTALGAKGKYLNADQEFDDVYIPSDVKAARYTVHHILPFVGGRLMITRLPYLTVPFMARVHLLRSFSHDDHLLRGKDAYGRATGIGFSASIAPEVPVTDMLSLGASAEAYYLNALQGVLKQEFYQDDPGTPDDETQSSVPDADFRVKSVRLQLMAFAKLTF